MSPSDMPGPTTACPRSSAPDPLGLELLARELAVGAGAIVRGERPERLTIDTKSSRSDVVTQMDGRAEAYVRDRLARLRPGDAVLGEETGRGAGTNEITWVVDPIDGTVNYLYGNPEYAVSLAAVVGDPTIVGQWLPIAGAVAHPEARLVYSAARGHGAWVRRIEPSDVELTDRGDYPGQGHPRDGDRLAPSGGDSLELTLLGTGFAYVAQERRRQARELLEILPQVRDIRRGGSAALDLCAVAAGRLDAYYERGINAWDIAAGWLIVTEAGGLVSGVGGDEPTNAGIVAATPGVHAALRDLIERVTLGRRP
ncbi:MAG: inositol monophosphatase family protein [Micrococcales bacterium]|nr:inositol monophosphatase family protein [Micrococcales bacterium]